MTPKKKKERVRKLTQQARESGLRNAIESPKIDGASMYTSELKDFLLVLRRLGVPEIIIDDNLTLGEIFSNSFLEEQECLSSPSMASLKKKYNFPPIRLNDPLKTILRRMHDSKNE